MKVGVLVSGSGTNLQALLDGVADGTLTARIAVVVSNVPGVRALDRAQGARIPTAVVPHTMFADRRAFDAALVDVLRAHDVELVVLAGFMRLVTEVLLDAYPMRVINVHPALLPAFPGTNAHRQALEYGVRVSGCTVHFVDRGTDTGPIIAQSPVPVEEGDDEEALRRRVLAQEHETLPRVVQWIAEGRVWTTRSESTGRVRVHVADSPRSFGKSGEAAPES